MIQPAALTALTAPATAAEPVAAQPGGSAQLADFGALLALQVLGSEPAAAALPVLPAALPPAQANAAAATAFPATGKILPGSLPPVLPVSFPDEVAQIAAVPDTAESTDEAELSGVPDLVQPLLLLAVQPALPERTPAPAAAPDAAAASAAPRLPTAAPQAAQSPVQPLAQLPPQPTAQPNAKPVANLRPETVLAVRASSEPALAEAASPAEPAIITAQLLQNGTAPSVAATAPTPADRPQDFAALVDRLVAAREALQPQSVTLAVRHSDFGAVQLRFQQDASGLSVALASADPDFARAVSAAVQPVSATDTANSTGNNNTGSSFSQTGSGAASDSSAQSRSGQQARRDDRAGVLSNPAAAAVSNTDEALHQGIFA